MSPELATEVTVCTYETRLRGLGRGNEGREQGGRWLLNRSCLERLFETCSLLVPGPVLLWVTA
jgi:hypothetical protein